MVEMAFILMVNGICKWCEGDGNIRLMLRLNAFCGEAHASGAIGKEAYGYCTRRMALATKILNEDVNN